MADVRRILGEPIAEVSDAEELLWRVAALLDGPVADAERRNLRIRIRKALAGGDWRDVLTEEDDRYDD